MIKLVAFDLDGTVVNHENRLTPSTVETIGRLIDLGIHVASISGRGITNSQRPFRFHTDFASVLSVGSYNGAVALDRERDGLRRKLHEQRLPDDLFGELIASLDEDGYNYIYCHLEFGDKGGISEDYMTLRRDQTIKDMELQNGAEFVIDPDLTDKIRSGHYGVPPKVLVCPGKEQREAVYDSLKERFSDTLYIERTDIDRVEAMNLDVNKERALVAICEACGVSLGEAMALGDGSNDLPMLQAAGVGVLLGNADAKTRAAAKDVIIGQSFKDNGFSLAVEEYLQL